MREARVKEDVEAFVGPVTIAAFVELGWFQEWPLSITTRGRAAVRRGYGRDNLPLGNLCDGVKGEDGMPLRKYHYRLDGAYYWEGRRA